MANIVLIGFSGSGKSTYGKKLARRMGYEFCDLDLLFESRYHISISEFFSKYGEMAFRICERSVLENALEGENRVISAGGGTPCFFDSMDLILRKSFSVYIRLSEKSLYERLSNSRKPRPLLEGRDEASLKAYIAETLAERSKFYERAELVVKGEGLTADALQSAVELGMMDKENRGVAPPGIEPESKV